MSLREQSIKAKDRQTPTGKLTKQALVYNYILSKGANGATDEEAMGVLCFRSGDEGVGFNTYRARRGELEEMGMIYDSGEERQTISGSGATVWVALK